MKKRYPTTIVFFLLLTNSYHSQNIPIYRTHEWNKSGVKTFLECSDSINVYDYGAVGDGVTVNNNALVQSISALNNSPGTVYLPSRVFYFTDPISIPSNVVIKGSGALNTTLIFNLDSNETDLIDINGVRESMTYTVVNSALIFDSVIVLNQGGGNDFSGGDYIQLYKNDSTEITSNWALNTVGQLIKVNEVKGDSLFLNSKLRTNYPITQSPYLRKIIPKTNVGIECLKIVRLDTQTVHCANIRFNYAVNCYVKGIESDKCNFSHISFIRSSNITVRGSYFHHAFDYGGGGTGYGVVAMYSSGECLVENNIFKDLRHSMLLQAGANGNVFSYNYSINPYWTGVSLPSNSAGDLVLHGNYPYANLFEGNICQNIVIDDSHGSNGPHNTFLRNRASSYGLVMNSGGLTDSCNFIGNEITSNAFFQGLYSLNGVGHYEYGNNIKGSIIPIGTSSDVINSLYLENIPVFLSSNQFPFCGAPITYNTMSNSAFIREPGIDKTICIELQHTSINIFSEKKMGIFPNPSSAIVNFVEPTKVKFYNNLGELVFGSKSKIKIIDVSSFPKGIYIIRTDFSVAKLIIQ